MQITAFFIAIALYNIQAWGQETAKETEIAETKIVSLSVEQAVSYALENSRTLKSADIDLEIKERASKYSWNVLLPNVQVTGTLARANEYSPSNYSLYNNLIAPLHNLPAAATDFEDEEARWSVVGGASIGLNLSLAYINQIKAAKADYENGKITFEQSQKEQIMNIKKIFYGLLLQQENLKIQKATLENARQRMVQAQTNYRNGAIPELSLLQTQVNYENSKPEVDTAEMNLNQQLDTFVFLIGMPVGTKVALEGEISPKYIDITADDLIAKYGNESLDIKSLQCSIDSLKLSLGAINLSTWTPALSINYSLSPAYLGDAFSFYKDIGKDDMWYDSGTLSLTLAWNITNMLPWSSNRQQAKDLTANLKKLEITMETLKENQKISVRKAVDTLNQARAQIDSMTRSVQLAQRAYDMTYRAYRNGTTELLDLRDAEQSLNQAKLGLVNQKYNYLSALFDLENTLNADLTSETLSTTEKK
ncbi:MAG: TolC family protein [Treponema sp.]|nr:TolC family protein [Treponema sp.]